MNPSIFNMLLAELTKKGNGTEDTLYDFLYQTRQRKNKFLSLIIFGAFILTFLFYYQYNLIFAFFVFLFFVIWYLNSDLNVFSKRYKDDYHQYINCFTDAQNFIVKGKFDKAYDSLSHYRNRYNDSEAMVLYQLTLFYKEEYELYISNLKFCDSINNDAYKLLTGIVYFLKRQNDDAVTVFTESNKLTDGLKLIKYYFLVLIYQPTSLSAGYIEEIRNMKITEYDTNNNRLLILKLFELDK